MLAKPSFAQRLQTAKMASSRTSVQNNNTKAQNNDPWMQIVLLEHKIFFLHMHAKPSFAHCLQTAKIIALGCAK